MRERARGVPVWGLARARRRAHRAGATAGNPTGPGAASDGGRRKRAAEAGGESGGGGRRAEERVVALSCEGAKLAPALVLAGPKPRPAAPPDLERRPVGNVGTERRRWAESGGKGHGPLLCGSLFGSRIHSVGPEPRPIAPPDLERRPMGDAKTERQRWAESRGEGHGPLLCGSREPIRNGDVLAASPGLRFDRRPPLASEECPVRVRSADDGRLCHRLCEEPCKGKREKERERGREGEAHRRPALDRSPTVGLPRNWPAAALATGTALPYFG